MWAAGIKAETLYKENPNAQDQNEYALKTGIPLLISLGQNEIDAGIVKVKQLNTREEEDVPRDVMVSRLFQLIAENPVLLTKEQQEQAKNASQQLPSVVAEYEKQLANKQWFGGNRPS